MLLSPSGSDPRVWRQDLDNRHVSLTKLATCLGLFAMPANKTYYVYIVTNTARRPLYVGVTHDLVRRIHEHRLPIADSFTSRYNLSRLVHFECYDDIRNAIQREKSLKHWFRAWKIDLIERDNADWEDLFEGICR